MLSNTTHIATTYYSLQSTQGRLLPALTSICFLGIAYLVLHSRTSALDLVNGKGAFELTSVRVKKNFMRDAHKIITERFTRLPGKPFRVIADVGEVTILPPEYAHEIRNDDKFSFTKAAFQVRRM